MNNEIIIYNILAATNLPKNWPRFGRIQFQNLYLYYVQNNSPALKNLNINIEHGEKVCILLPVKINCVKENCNEIKKIKHIY